MTIKKGQLLAAMRGASHDEDQLVEDLRELLRRDEVEYARLEAAREAGDKRGERRWSTACLDTRFEVRVLLDTAKRRGINTAQLVERALDADAAERAA